jgi:hypothetical protein
VRAVHQDTHRPEKAGVWKDALDVEPVARTRDVIRGGSTVIPSERSESRNPEYGGEWGAGSGEALRRPSPTTPHSPPPTRVLQMVRESEPAPVTTAAHRALEPAEPVDVECEGEVPRVVTWRGHRIPVSRPIGPERLSGDWWDDGYRRDYWRCESLAGEFVVYLDRADDAWRLQGWVD